MTEAIFRKDFGHLSPDSEEAYKILRNIGNGEIVVCDIKDPRRRSTEQHRFYFVLLTHLYESQEYYKSLDAFRGALLVKLGHCDEYQMKGGGVYYHPHSLAYGKMSQEQFSALVDETLDFAESIGFDRDELLRYTRERAGMVY